MQPRQVGEPAGVAVPAWHGVQVPEAWLYLPLGQSVHLVEPSAEYLPAAQPVQLVEEVLGWNLPLGQVLQVPET